MKFSIGAVAAFSLAANVAFAGTLSEGKPHNGASLKVLAVKSSQFEAHEARLADFTNRTGIKVSYTYIPFPNMREALTAEMIGGTGDYDVVTIMDQWVAGMEMLVSPINDGISKHKIDLANYPKAHLEQGRIKGNLVGLPVRGHVQLLFYRADLLKKNSLQPPTTWPQVVSVSKTLAEKENIAGIALPYGKLSGQNLMVWYNLLWGRGGALFDAKGKPAFNTEAGIAATQEYIGFLNKEKITPAGAAGFVEQDAVNSFKQGNSAMLPVWWWVRSQLTDAKQSKLTEEQVGFAPLPSYEGKGSTTYTNTWVFGVNDKSKKKAAAMEFLSWLTDPSLEKEVLLDPKQNEVVAVQFSNLRDAEVNKRWGGMHAAAAKALETAPPMVYGEDWPQVAEVLENMMSSLASGAKTDVKSTLDAAAAEISKFRK